MVNMGFWQGVKSYSWSSEMRDQLQGSMIVSLAATL